MLRVWQCCGAEVFLWAAEFDNSKNFNRFLTTSVVDLDPYPDPHHFAGSGSLIFSMDPDPDPDQN